MPKRVENLKRRQDGTARVTLTLDENDLALIDAVRSGVPVATFARLALMREVIRMKMDTERR